MPMCYTLNHRNGDMPPAFTGLMSILILLITAAALVRADPNPSGPGPGDVFVEGKACTISWDVDPTGVWKTMHIDLMTGDNFNMVTLAPVGIVDGTNPRKKSLSYTCPQVTPHSPIYFYQFSSPQTSNTTWTGRFAITDATEKIVPPSQPTQSDGTNIPWGTGALVGKPPQLNGAGGGTVGSALSVHAAGVNTTFTLSTVQSSTLHSTSTQSTTSSTPTVVAAKGANGAAAAMSSWSIMLTLQTGLALGIAAFGFILMC